MLHKSPRPRRQSSRPLGATGLGNRGRPAADPGGGHDLPRRPHWLADYLLIAVGASAMALGISSLIVPARLADGGLSGIAITLHYLTGLGVGPLYAGLNVPLLVWAWVTQGPRFVWRTVLGVALVSAGVAAFAPVRLVLGDRLLAALYGGLLVGGGIGLVLRAGGSTGGADILARYLNLRHGWTYNQTFLVTDLVVLAAVAIWVGLPAAMYAWIATNVAGRVVTYVVEGPRRGRLALLVTAADQAVLRRIVGEMDRGATRLLAQGAYTGSARPLLLVAVAQQEVVHLRSIVAEEDPRAFLVILPAAEVLGEGFRLLEGSARRPRAAPPRGPAPAGRPAAPDHPPGR